MLSKESPVLICFHHYEKAAVGLSEVQPCQRQSGDTLDDTVTPSGKGEMSTSFGRSQVAETGLMAVVVPLLLIFRTLMFEGLKFK